MQAPDELRRVCKKIVHGYRLKRETMTQRYRILKAMEKDYTLRATDSLKSILWKERHLVDLLIKDERHGMTFIGHAQRIVFNEIQKRRRIHADDVVIFEEELEAYFHTVLMLLHRLEKNALHTKDRMTVELHMIRHNSDPHVKRFVHLWNKELEENANLTRFFHEIVLRQKDLQNRVLSIKAHHIMGSGTLAELAMVMGTLSGFLAELEPVMTTYTSLPAPGMKGQ